jgi:hypothetical protein
MIITSEESVGGVLQLCEEKRGVQKKFEYLSPTRIMLTYEMPLNEIVLDFYDRLKSVSRGYASLDYHLSGYRESDLVKLDVLVGGEPVDALTMICHREQSYDRGRDLVIAPAETDSAADVRGGHSSRHRQPRDRARDHQRHSQERDREVLRRRHFSRKRKLLEKQKEGKKRMKRVGRVDIPQEAFLAVLKVAGSIITRSRPARRASLCCSIRRRSTRARPCKSKDEMRVPAFVTRCLTAPRRTRKRVPSANERSSSRCCRRRTSVSIWRKPRCVCKSRTWCRRSERK